MHYVASRSFETAEEADEWLSFLVEEQGYTIDHPAGELLLYTPLHCACEWGNAFGVEWLVSHGASIDFEDECGNTPYKSACASSVDALKKMLILEKRGCKVSPNAIIVAGRNRFSSSKEAHEVLHHLVCERGMSVNAQGGVLTYGTPLYNAFSSGSIFGVQWLMSNGANVHAILADEDILPIYNDVCGGSIDTLEKLRILEEHGSPVPPDVVFPAASCQYSSCKEAHDVLHHLVVEKGLGINSYDRAVPSWGTPLHYACMSGSFSVVKWLVEHGASVNNLLVDGVTPFMFACESSVDRRLKVHYLSEKGADFLVKDNNNRTALFYAARYSISNKVQNLRHVPTESTLAYECSISQEDFKDVLQLLVTGKGLEINSVDRFGMTPLLYACCCVYYPVLAVRQLIELGADINAKTFMNQNALHLSDNTNTEYTNYISVFEFLIQSGVDVTCKDKKGRAPYQVAFDGEIKMLLRQHYDAVRFSVLREKVRPDSIKVCVIGDEMAGKTTLVNSLLQLDLPPIEDEDRTAGIVIRSGHIPGVGKGTTWDFGAQSTFHSAHGLFFGPSNTLFVLVLFFRKGHSVKPELCLLESGRYWCAFVKAALRLLPPHLRSLLRLLIVGNVIDCGEEKGIEASFQLKRVAEVLQEEFGDTFEIVHVLEMDCSKNDSVRMNDSREKLKVLRQKMLEEADDVPKLCHAIEEKLSLCDETLECFMSLENFYEWVAHDVEVVLTEDERKISVEYLDSTGIIVNLGRRICLRPVWLCCNVIGPLLAPRYFPFGMKTAKPGIVTRKDIESALRAFENYLKHKGTPSPFSVTADSATEVLLYLELCIEAQHAPPGVYQIPALLQDSTPGDAWVENPELDVYRGQRYECANSVDIILPLSFVVFQSRSSRISETSHETWKDGVKLVKIVGEKVIECLVTLGMKKGHCCIDVVLRWSSQTSCHELAKQMLDKLKAMIVAVCEERSPGVLLNWFYLDSTHLKRFDKDPAIYSSRMVNKKVEDNAVNDKLFSDRSKGCYSSVKDLAIVEVVQEKRAGPCIERVVWRPAEIASQVVSKSSAAPCKGGFPADDDVVSDKLLTACSIVASSCWEEIGTFLLDSSRIDEVREQSRSNTFRAKRVLESWKRKTETPTVRKLLKWLKLAGISKRSIEDAHSELSTS
ncbi:death-associated protein kinase 1-like isoform X4 [Oscarella lobularis]